MAKPSPVMKHAKPKLTAEQIAIEEFMNSIPPTQVMEGDVCIDNTIRETMDVVEDPGLDPMVDSMAVADSLDELADDVTEVTQAPALESYKRIFRQITEMTGHPVASLEQFPATKGGRARLVRAIRNHANEIRECVCVALEDYVDKVDESIGTTMSNYKQALKALSEVKESDIDVHGEVTINHKRVWALFHMDGKLMDLRSFGEEVDGVKKLAEYVSKGLAAVQKWQTGQDMQAKAIDGKDTINLMNNLRVTIKDGRSHWEQLPVPKPDKAWTAGDWFWVFFFAFAFAGLIYRAVKGGSGDEITKKQQSLKALHKVVGELKRLAPIVQGIEKDAKAIMAIVEHAPEEEIANVKRAVSPVLELASKTIQHVADVTYGAKKMFEEAEQ